MMFDMTNLNSFQIKKIKNRLQLNFINELDKNAEKKIDFFKKFSKKIELVVNELSHHGVLFYSLAIKLPYSYEDSSLWTKIHTDVEEFINYIGFSIELIEFCYFSLEIDGLTPKWQNKKKHEELKEKVLFIRGIIGIRSLIGKNKFLLFEIQKLFDLSFFDVKVKQLSKINEVLKSWNFIIKQKNFKFHSFGNYSSFHSSLYGLIADQEIKFEGYSAFGQENNFTSKTKDIKGIDKKNLTKQFYIC